VVERVDHLQAIPELAFERGIQEVATVKDVHVAATGLQTTHDGDDATEAAGIAVFDGANPIRVVEMHERQALRFALGQTRASRKDQQEEDIEQCDFFHAGMLT